MDRMTAEKRPPIVIRLLCAVLLAALGCAVGVTVLAPGPSQAAVAGPPEAPDAPSASDPPPAADDPPESQPGTGPASGAEPRRPRLGGTDDVLGPGRWHRTDAGRTWYGAYRSLTDAFAYCVDAGLGTPYPRYFEGSKGRLVSSPETAWALHMHGDSPKRDVQSALSAIAKLDPAIEHRHAITPRKPSALGSDFAGAARSHASITAAAEKAAGPYTLELELDEVDPQSRTARAHVVLLSASRHPVPDVTVEITVDGGSAEASRVTTAAESAAVEITADGGGELSVQAHATGLPAVDVRFHEAEGPGARGVQNVIAPGPSTEARATAKRDYAPRSAPSVVTTITDELPEPGAPVTDEFTVSGLADGAVVDVEHVLWGSPIEPERAQGPHQEAFEIGRVTSKDVGNGDHTSAAVTLPDDFRGWVYWTESIAADDSTDGWESDHGIPDETGLVRWTPEASTRALHDEDAGTLSDRIRITGAQPDSRLEVTAVAYHSATRPEQSAEPSGVEFGRTVTEVEVDDEGAADLTVGPLAGPTFSGWVTWVVTIGGTDRSVSWTSDWGIPEETVEVPGTTPPGTASPPGTATPPMPTRPGSPTPGSAPPTTDAPAAPSTESPAAPSAQPSSPDSPSAPGDRPPEDDGPPAEGMPPADEGPHAGEAPPQQPSSHELPRTGARSGALIGVALILIGAGVGVLILSARRTDEA